jgi:methyl coenzyme M reductase subunit C-like uncharacterized protein (methanogenesis marker protein 7)
MVAVADLERMRHMSRTLTIAIISALMLGTASAALARSSSQHGVNYYACQTDEGYGRTNPCDAGGGN